MHGYLKLPILETLRTYTRAMLRNDVIAGVAVAGVCIPQAMAYSRLAGAPITAGLYAALVAMVLYAVFTTSRQVIVGPDAAMSALTGAALLPLVGGDPSRYTSLVTLLAILIGISCIIAVVGNLSFISEFLSRPILLGYMAGLALAVIASQLPYLFGVSSTPRSNFFTSVWHVLTELGNIHVPTLVFSLVLGVIAYYANKKSFKLPVSIVILGVGLLASIVLNFDGRGIAMVGDIPKGLPLPSAPSLRFSDVQALIIPALAIMMVAYANTIAVSRSFPLKGVRPVDPSQEFAALGISNIFAGVFQGLPVSASGARTAVNSQSKANSQLSQIFGAIVIGLALLFLTPVLKYIPLSALAVILTAAIIKLLDYSEFRSIWHAWRSEAALVIITTLGVTILGIFQGLLLAVLLAIGNLIRLSAFPSDAVLGVAEDGSIRDKSRPPKTELIPGIIMYRFDAPLYFGNASQFRDRVIELVEDEPEAKWFLWDAETITSIDSTAGAMLLSLIRELKSRDITFCIARLKGPIRSTINKTHRLNHVFQTTPHFPSMGQALEAFEAEHKQPIDPKKTNVIAKNKPEEEAEPKKDKSKQKEES